MSPRPGLLLDRDGVVNVEIHRLHRADDVVLIDGVAEVVGAMNAAGTKVAVVTNQAGIGHGLYDEAAYRSVNARIARLLAPARIDGWFHCPHTPADGCACRKPAPGLLEQAAQALELDLRRSVLVGDKRSDLEAARAAGATAFLVRTGYGREAEADTAARQLFEACADSLVDLLPAIRARLGRA